MRLKSRKATRRNEDRTGQLPLLVAPPASDIRYESLHEQGLRDASRNLLEVLTRVGTARFREIWPSLLEAHHITKVELARVAWDLGKRGEIAVTNSTARERTVRDDHLLRLKA